MKSGLKTLNTAFPKPTVNCAKPTLNGNVTTVGPKAVVSDNKGTEANAVKASACWVWRPKQKVLDHGNPQQELKDKGVIDSGCSRHMTRNRSYLIDYEEIDGGFVAFGGNFKLTDESYVLLKVPRKDNMYSIDLKNVVLQRGLTCLFAKATTDESNLWHRRLGHVNFKTINKLVKGNLVRGLPSKLFEINQTCVACQKGKHHKASCKTKTVSSISQPLQMLHMDLFGPTFVKSLIKKMYGLVVTDDYSREFSVARTPQQNGVAKRKNKTLIEAARTMLADSKLPTTFWAEAVNTACYVQNRVLIIKPHNKTPYELFLGRKHALSFMRPFGCPVTILNTIDHLGSGPKWLFDIDALTKSMNYELVVAGNQSNGNTGTKECNDAGKVRVETVSGKDYILLPFLTQNPSFSSNSKDSPDDGFKPSREKEKKDAEDPRNEDSEDNVVDETVVYGCDDDPNMLNLEEIVYSDDDEGIGAEADMTNLDTHILASLIPTTKIHKDHPFSAIEDQPQRFSKLSVCMFLITSRAQKDNPSITRSKLDRSYARIASAVQVTTSLDLGGFTTWKRTIGTKWVYKNKKDERGIVIRNKARLVAQGYTQKEGINYDEVFALVARIEAIRLFLAYASFKDFVVYQMDVKSAFLYGKIEEEVYVCQPPVFKDLEFPNRVYKIEKALYGLNQAPRAWYETLSTYLLDNGFQRGIIDKTLFIKKVKGDIILVQVYIDDIIFGSIKKNLCTEFKKLMHKKFQMSSMGELTFFLGLQVTQKNDGVFINQDKYVDEILKKFGFSTMKITSTPMETSKPSMKD
ncbi:putative ribonuclease H-like domain-containing protein, partial [Tanacetum coccineum]